VGKYDVVGEVDVVDVVDVVEVAAGEQPRIYVVQNLYAFHY
jgi:hypothetical protein